MEPDKEGGEFELGFSFFGSRDLRERGTAVFEPPAAVIADGGVPAPKGNPALGGDTPPPKDDDNPPPDPGGDTPPPPPCC